MGAGHVLPHVPRPVRAGRGVTSSRGRRSPSMDAREPLVTVEEARKVTALLLAWGSDEPDLALEAERLAHDLALRLPEG